MPLHIHTAESLRSYSRCAIENLEYWLRRLIDDSLRKEYGSEYINAVKPCGDNLINGQIRKSIQDRFDSRPGRYPRLIDAAQLEEEISIICNPALYGQYFEDALKGAFPDGSEEARTFLSRLKEPRNRLSHANSISIRQAEQVICYTNDAIESLKSFYSAENMNNPYNVPMVIAVSDSFGNTLHAGAIHRNNTGRGRVNFQNSPGSLLYVGDTISLAIEVDPTFEPEGYRIDWTHTNRGGPMIDDQKGLQFSLQIENEHVTNDFVIYCSIKSIGKEWHRLGDCDDSIAVTYRVVPRDH